MPATFVAEFEGLGAEADGCLTATMIHTMISDPTHPELNPTAVRNARLLTTTGASSSSGRLGKPGPICAGSSRLKRPYPRQPCKHPAWG
jgi:hypothetical protein